MERLGEGPVLLQPCLGGSGKTLMFVNVSPTDTNIDETQNSLVYATRVRTIKVRVRLTGGADRVLCSRELPGHTCAVSTAGACLRASC